jgi:hypothetical protein
MSEITTIICSGALWMLLGIAFGLTYAEETKKVEAK